MQIHNWHLPKDMEDWQLVYSIQIYLTILS